MMTNQSFLLGVMRSLKFLILSQSAEPFDEHAVPPVFFRFPFLRLFEVIYVVVLVHIRMWSVRFMLGGMYCVRTFRNCKDNKNFSEVSGQAHFFAFWTEKPNFPIISPNP